jgi:hypothetical protein
MKPSPVRTANPAKPVTAVVAASVGVVGAAVVGIVTAAKQPMALATAISVADAADAGFRPCARCLPDAYATWRSTAGTSPTAPEQPPAAEAGDTPEE